MSSSFSPPTAFLLKTVLSVLVHLHLLLRSLAPGQTPMHHFFQRQLLRLHLAVPMRESCPPHQTWCTANTVQPLKEVVAWTGLPWPAMLFSTSAFLALVPYGSFFIRGLLRCSAKIFLSGCWGEEDLKTFSSPLSQCLVLFHFCLLPLSLLLVPCRSLLFEAPWALRPFPTSVLLHLAFNWSCFMGTKWKRRVMLFSV